MKQSLISRKFLKSFNFRVFNESDYYAFAGVESPIPLIAERDCFLVILDGDYCEVYIDGEGDAPFDTCENIKRLPLIAN
jgi:hypothetical protein